MTSVNKVNANRANAKLSTGPKTPLGRSRSSRNARRHGLSISILLDRGLAQEIKPLALRLNQTFGIVGSIALAYCLAEAEIDRKRIRNIKRDLLEKLDKKLKPFSTHRCKHRPDVNLVASQKPRGDASELLNQMVLVGRYERRALAKRKSAMRQFATVVTNSAAFAKIGRTNPKNSTISKEA
jgi:hypothetical protein